MQFLLPYELRSDHKPEEVTPRFRHLIMEHAKGIQITGDFGSIVTQVFEGTDYEIWQHHLKIIRGITLTAVTDKAILTINYMLKGTAVAYLQRPEETILNKSTASLFYLPVSKHEVYFDEGEFHLLQIVLGPSNIRRLAKSYSEMKPMLNLAMAQSGEVLMYSSGIIGSKARSLLDEIIYCRANLSKMDIIIQSKILGLMLDYTKRLPSGDLRTGFELFKTDNERIVEVVKFIDSNLDKPLRIPSLAKNFGISETILYRHFKKQFGINLSVFIKRRRLEKAMLLIKESNISIKEIASMVGYDFTENFNHCFKNLFGNTPGFFRKMQRQNAEKSQEK